jgi:hypothetical protein
MPINFTHSLQQALNTIEHQISKEFIIHLHKTTRTLTNTDEILQNYGKAKWAIVDILNKNYQTNFNLYNWLNNKEDDVAHFINEAGSNTLNYSEFKTPHKFHLHLGIKGFVIAIEQLGQPFNAQEIQNNKIKQNKGAAFQFYNNSKSTIFFNHPTSSTAVYLQYLF